MEEKSPASTFSRRAFLLGAGKAVLMTTLVGRLFYLQIIESNKYTLLSEHNRVASRVMLPLRGQILDRNGDVIASNKNTFKAIYLNDKNIDPMDAVTFLQNILILSDEEQERILSDITQAASLAPITIADHLSWDEVSAIELHADELPGISVDVGQSRFYPHYGACAHLVGYVAKPNDKDKNADDPFLKLSGVQIGKTGIEKVCEHSLRGAAGFKNLEVNARRHIVRELGYTEGQPGEDLQLTVDLNLQKFVAQCLSVHKSASAVLLDAKKGEVIAAVSHPSFDPNLFVKGLSKDTWEEILHNPYKPLTNKPFSGMYAPGSTLKILVAIAFLENGISPNDKTFCTGFTEVNGHRFHCMKKGGHGPVDMTRALRESCDVYFYENAKKVGIDRLEEVLRRYGLGEKVFQDFPSEAAGLVPSRQWKEEKRGASWTVSDTIMTSIGQGFNLATPLQMAVMLARIINTDTKGFPLSLVMNPSEGSSILNVTLPDVTLDPKHRAIILEGMNEASNHPSGTSYRNRITQAGFEMGGKTGTSQVTRIRASDRKKGLTTTSHRQWAEREHAVFVGFAPIHDPRFVVCVLVEHGEGGGRVAAPVARDILYIAQKWQKG